MKRYLLLLLCLILPCFINAAPAPNGELESFDEGDNYKKHAAYKMIKGLPVKYTYSLGDYRKTKDYSSVEAWKNRTPIRLSELDAVHFKIYIDWALRLWPSDTALIWLTES